MSENAHIQCINFQKELKETLNELMELQQKYQNSMASLIYLSEEKDKAKKCLENLQLKFENIKNSFLDFDMEIYKKYRNYFKAEYKIQMAQKDVISLEKRLEYHNAETKKLEQQIKTLEETEKILRTSIEALYYKTKED